MILSLRLMVSSMVDEPEKGEYRVRRSLSLTPIDK